MRFTTKDHCSLTGQCLCVVATHCFPMHMCVPQVERGSTGPAPHGVLPLWPMGTAALMVSPFH